MGDRSEVPAIQMRSKKVRPVPHRKTRNLNKKTLPQQKIRTNCQMQALHQVEAKKRQTEVDLDNVFSTVFLTTF